jgi:hypothetical protein
MVKNLTIEPMKKIFYILLLCSTQAFAQAPTKVWDKTIGGSSDDIAYSSVATSDGGFVIVGSSSSGISGDKSEASKGESDYWIVKFNSTGQKVWDKTIGGSSLDNAESVVSTSDGGFVVAGHSFSGISGDKSEANKGRSDFWIVKINSGGQKIWDKTIGGSDYDNAFSIISTSDGGFLVVGSSESNISGDKSENNRDNTNATYDYWIVKLNGNGQKIWDKTIGGGSDDYPESIIQTSDGSFVLVGFSISGISGDKTQGSQGLYDYWIVKLNSTGQKVWDKTIGGDSDEEAGSIIQTSDGGFVVVGSSSSGISGDKSEASKGLTDYWIVKLNSIGQKVWDKTIGGIGNDAAGSIIQTSDGGFVVAGGSDSFISGDKTEGSQGLLDYWIVKLNSIGQKVWDKTIGSGSNDYLTSIISTSDDGFVVGGFSDSGISGDKSEAPKGNNDYWIVKLGSSAISIYETITTGNWNANGTWNTNTPPTATNTAKINATHTVNIPNAGNNVKTIQMNGGNINLTGGTLEIKNQ